jgi:hypothetical protein
MKGYMPEEKSKSTLSKIIGAMKVILLWAGSLYVWLMYAYNNMDRSEEAFKHTMGTGPMLSGYSVPILGLVLAVLLNRSVFNKKINVKNVLTKVLVILIFGIGLWWQIEYDPALAKLMAYKAPKKDFSGMELFTSINSYRKSIGAQELVLDETLCSNLVERWLAVKNPENGHKGLIEWWNDKKLSVDPYGNINELYATANTANRVIELWTESPGHKLSLDDIKSNVGCTYASEGTGVLIIAERKN